MSLYVTYLLLTLNSAIKTWQVKNTNRTLLKNTFKKYLQLHFRSGLQNWQLPMTRAASAWSRSWLQVYIYFHTTCSTMSNYTCHENLTWSCTWSKLLPADHYVIWIWNIQTQAHTLVCPLIGSVERKTDDWGRSQMMCLADMAWLIFPLKCLIPSPSAIYLA